LLVVVCAACIQPRVVPCNGDLICPLDTVCVASSFCATPDQVAACNGLIDHQTCTAGGTYGACTDGACVATEWTATAIIGKHLVATNVELIDVRGVAVDAAGNVYIADGYGERIRRVSPDGAITTIAGNGTDGFSGDLGPAIDAQLQIPTDMAVDAVGNLFIVDKFNHVIRQVDPNGTITTVAGTGTAGYSGDGGFALGAMLDTPNGVAVDGAGNLYIADTNNHAIRHVDTHGVITTIAGKPTMIGVSGDGGPATAALLSYPAGVRLDAAGNLYFAEATTSRIRRIDTAGVITTFAGNSTTGYAGDGGPATSAALNGPGGVAIDATGAVLIADSGNQIIRRVDPTTGIITTIAGIVTTGMCTGAGDGGPATAASLCGASKIAVGAGGLYIAESTTIRHVDASGTVSTFAGTRAIGSTDDGGASTSAAIGENGIAIDPSGAILLADVYGHRIRRCDPSGIVSTFAGTTVSGSSGDGGPATSAQLQAPSDIVFDGSGNLLVADQGGSVRRIDTNGTITTVAGTGVAGWKGDGGPATSAQINPSAIAIDGAGNIYLAETGTSTVRKIGTNGIITTIAGIGTPGYSGDNGPAASAKLNQPTGVAVDTAGNVFIADTYNFRIRRVTPNGTISTIAGTGVRGASGDGGPATAATMETLSRLAFDATGNLFLTDSFVDKIRRIDTHGIITTIAGKGNFSGSAGDGGPVANAWLISPTAIIIDPGGAIYVADEGIRRISNGIIMAVAGNVDPRGMGPLSHAWLTDARALAIGSQLTLVAGGVTGTVEAVWANRPWLETAIGRYPELTPTGALARFRGSNFGEVDGVAYDEAAGLIYVAESPLNRIHVVTIVDPTDVTTWTIAPLANVAGTLGFVDGAAATAQFDNPTGLALDTVHHQLYVADTGNHAIRAIDLSSGPAAATVRTVVNTQGVRGFSGDGGPATDALLYGASALAICPNGDLFVADTNNDRVRRVSAATGVIATVVGNGMISSFGDGQPASGLPIDHPLGVTCSSVGDVFVSSRTTVRMLPSPTGGEVDGTGDVYTIYGASPRDTFPASATSCITGISATDPDTVRAVDQCAGVLIEIKRTPTK
jgi:sugar lactone lactonase YvrE